jgi:hypothetical protein
MTTPHISLPTPSTVWLIAVLYCALRHCSALSINFTASSHYPNVSSDISLNIPTHLLSLSHPTQHHIPLATMDFAAAFRAMCVEYSRGGPSGHLNQNINGGNFFNRDGLYASSNEGDSDRTLTYHEFIAAAMMNRCVSVSLWLSGSDDAMQRHAE